MIKTAFSTLALLFVLSHLSVNASAETPRTMRVDYFHTGSAAQELFSLDRVVVEPLAWPGDSQKAVDETNPGKYLFEVRDRNTNPWLYSPGFPSVYVKRETTAQA